MNGTSKEQLDADDFLNRYDLIQNHLESNAAFEGAWFETYGMEVEHIFSVPPECVWTIVDTDSGPWIIAGRHLVNRLGYLLTKQPWSEESEEFRFE